MRVTISNDLIDENVYKIDNISSASIYRSLVRKKVELYLWTHDYSTLGQLSTIGAITEYRPLVDEFRAYIRADHVHIGSEHDRK